jgi:hypothetical protein
MSTPASTITAADAAALPATPRARDGSLSLFGAFLQFYRFASPRLLSAAFAVALTARIAWGHWSVWDAVVAAAFLAWEPLQEWLIHVHLLHWRPRTVLGFHVDPYLARKHRRHHQNPFDVPTLFIPISTSLLSLAAHTAIWSTVLPEFGLFLTSMATMLGIGLCYEWTHYLIHTPYRPCSRLYRNLWQHHRLHHFKNERYWMGVTSDLADRVLGTKPEPKSVEVSATARNLLGGC